MAANESATCSGTEMQPQQTTNSSGIEGHGHGELIILITMLVSLFLAVGEIRCLLILIKPTSPSYTDAPNFTENKPELSGT